MALFSHYNQTDLGGGRLTEVHSLRPIAYLSNGYYRRITNALGASGDPTLPVGVSELVNLRMRDKLAGQSPVVFFGHGSDHVRFTPLGTNNVNGQTVGTSGYLYPEAWNNADLRLTIGGHRLYKEVLLKAGHPTTFQFRLDEHSAFDPLTGSFGSFRLLDPSLENPADGTFIPLTWAIAQSGGKYILTVTLPVGDYTGWVLDPTLALQPGAADGKDTFVYQASPATNYGVGTNLLQTAANVRGLIEFDLSSIPATATCQSATLTLTQSLSGAAQAFTVAVYSIAVGNAAWPEGTKAGTSGGAGDCCWTRLDQAASPTSWAGSAGLSTSGTDYEASSLGSFSGNKSDANGTAYSTTLTAARVQGWFGATNTNYGLLLIPTADCGGLASSDHATAAYRPALTATYSVATVATSLPRRCPRRFL